MRYVLLAASIALLTTGALATQSAIAIAHTISKPSPAETTAAVRIPPVQGPDMKGDLHLTFTPGRHSARN